MDFIWFSERTAIISQNSGNRLVFLLEMAFEAQTKVLDII
jgi:hypothetical protein